MALTILAILVLLVFAGLIALRMMSRKCPFCDHYTLIRENKQFRCDNGHCGALFTRKNGES